MVPGSSGAAPGPGPGPGRGPARSDRTVGRAARPASPGTESRITLRGTTTGLSGRATAPVSRAAGPGLGT
eukprot:760347-Hanusia_phi.AAC.1